MKTNDHHERVLTRKISDYQTAQKVLEIEEEEYIEVSKRLTELKEAQSIIIELCSKIQEKIHIEMSKLVSQCLALVFDDPYTFKILFERKRGKTEAQLVFMRGENQIDPTTECGGGVLDVAAFALRISALILSTPAKRRVLILDEPFRFLSAGYQERIQELINGLSKKLNIQFIIVTHEENLQLGKVITIGD